MTYTRSTVMGVPRADVVEVNGPDPASVLLAELPGWLVGCGEQLGTTLLTAGALHVRHAHRMERDLRTAPPPAVEDLPAPPGSRFVPCRLDARELFPAWNAAYPGGHPDRPDGTDEEIITHHLGSILEGTRLGPVLPVSTLLLGDDGEVRAVIIVVHFRAAAWVIQLFRRPGAGLSGVGELLLQRACAELAGFGRTRVGLAVSTANPAMSVYERVGFRVASTSRTVQIPEHRSG